MKPSPEKKEQATKTPHTPAAEAEETDKKTADPKNKPAPTQEEDDAENPFGGMKAGNFKRNLGCGG